MELPESPVQNWASQRAARFTASQIYKLFTEPRSKADKEAGLLSETAKTYIIEVAMEELTGYRAEIKGAALDHGIEYEEEAFEAFKLFSGLPFDFTGKTFYPLGGNSGASPDGVLYDGITVMATADIKCPFNPINFYKAKIEMVEGDPKMQGVSPNYFYQKQLQMLATGAKEGYLVRYLADRQADKFGNTYEYNLPLENRIFWKVLKPDAEVQDQILLKIKQAEIYKKYVIEQFMETQQFN